MDCFEAPLAVQSHQQCDFGCKWSPRVTGHTAWPGRPPRFVTAALAIVVRYISIASAVLTVRATSQGIKLVLLAFDLFTLWILHISLATTQTVIVHSPFQIDCCRTLLPQQCL